MEGWLEVPPERNLIGRAAWKPRYVRFANGPPSTAPAAAGSRASIAPSSPLVARPLTSGGGSGTGTGGGVNKRPLERSQSTHQVAALASPADTRTNAGGWFLAVYKQKGDTEPIARYPLHTIASCYVGDVASRKKKSAIQPTLVVHLRPEALASYSSAARAFRRRSQDALPKLEASRRESSSSSSSSTLMFRPAPTHEVGEPDSLDHWAKEIQSRLMAGRTSSLSKENTSAGAGVGVESAFREKFHHEAPDFGYTYGFDSPAPSPSSLFLVNGEPSTALLSPSIRSRASNLSSIDSDDKLSIMSSSASELVSPREEKHPQRSHSSLSDHYTQPPLHLATPGKLGSTAFDVDIDPIGTDLTPVPSRNRPPEPPDLVEPVAQYPSGRRETILDRFFSIAGPEAPTPTPSSELSSLARFEALMREMEERNAKIVENPSMPVMMHDNPRRIPSPTQRALEFVLTGCRPHSPGDGQSGPGMGQGLTVPPVQHGGGGSGGSPSSSRRSSLANAVLTPTPANTRWQRRHSDEASVATSRSSGGGGGAEKGSGAEAAVGAGHKKRHSLADFSMMRLSSSSSGLGTGGGGGDGRRGSHGDVSIRSGRSGGSNCGGGEVRAITVTPPPPRRAMTDMGDVRPFGDGEFGAGTEIGNTHAHPPVSHAPARPLFREFSF